MTEDETTRTEFDYVFDLIIRKRTLENHIKNPPENTSISTERFLSEIRAFEDWDKTGKGTPTTGDKAIYKYYPLPAKPDPVKSSGEKPQRRLKPAGILAEMVRSAYPTQPDGTSPMTDRQAWNRLPEAADWMIKDHIECKPSRESRGRATLTASWPDSVTNKITEEEITFKQFAKAWENKKRDPEKIKATAIRKKERDEAREYFIGKGLLKE